MNASTFSCAKKYARAYANLCNNTFDPQEIAQLRNLAITLHQHRNLALQLTSTTPATKITTIAHGLGLSRLGSNLLITLAQHNRIGLLANIATHLEQFYTTQCQRLVCTVSSSHPLQDTQKITIVQFIKRATSMADVQATFLITPALISGIRIQSTNLLWERSLRKTLNLINHRLVLRANP